MSKRPISTESQPDDTPPIGRSWRNLYIAVLVNLAVMIALFYAFTKAFQ